MIRRENHDVESNLRPTSRSTFVLDIEASKKSGRLSSSRTPAVCRGTIAPISTIPQQQRSSMSSTRGNSVDHASTSTEHRRSPWSETIDLAEGGEPSKTPPSASQARGGDELVDPSTIERDKWVVHKKGRTCLARKYLLAVQATSSSSERLFSTAGNTVTVKRARLSDDNVEKHRFPPL